MGNPTYYYSTGNVYVKFKKVQSGVDVFISGGMDYDNATVTVQDGDAKVQLNKEYKIDQSINFIITAVPEYNNYHTTYEFEYWTDGVEYPLWERFYLTSFVKNPNGE